MSNLVCVTCQACCAEPLAQRIARIVAARPAAVILREKTLEPDVLKSLAVQIAGVCATHDVPFVLNGPLELALELGCTAVHAPLPALRAATPDLRRTFASLGTSVHSVDEAREAVRLGATRLIAGHVFPTDCKAGLAPRGLSFLRAVCAAVNVPVYAIGGITPDVLADVRAAGASGACIMSGLMRTADPAALLAACDRAWNADSPAQTV